MSCVREDIAYSVHPVGEFSHDAKIGATTPDRPE